MHQVTRIAAIAAALALVAGSAAAQPRERIQAGTLTCDISGGFGLIIGSQQALSCAFRTSLPGPPEFYSGTLTKVGVDLGLTTGSVMVWTVYAPTNQRTGGALAGSYVGVSAQATVGGGVGANVMVGGSNRTIELQPLSLQGQTGLNVAAGVAGIDLRWVR